MKISIKQTESKQKTLLEYLVFSNGKKYIISFLSWYIDKRFARNLLLFYIAN